MEQLETRMGQLEPQIIKLETQITRLETDVSHTSLLVENDISKKIDIIGEGHNFLKQSLSDALQMEIRRERMELEIVNLQIDVKKIKEHLDIA